MKKIALLVFTIFFLFSCSFMEESDQSMKSVTQLIKRILPEYADQFILLKLSENSNDVFEIESKNDRIIIRGNNPVSVATGFNWYLKHVCNSSISWTGDNLNLKNLVPVTEKIRKEARGNIRYYLNYCTHSYSMAFWDWERWEHEIDWMAMNGINTPLAIVGQEAVWQNTLRKFDFTEKEISNFIPGPGFGAWWLMGNLEGWGGPLPQNWIDTHVELQQKILKRMRKLGMEPVLQGFYGMVPIKMIEKFPESKIHDIGPWCGFTRPAFLEATDPLFPKIAKVFYEKQEKLFGKNKYFGGDPFHEGGRTQGIDITQSAKNIYKVMNDVNPGAIWVLQAWQNNPKPELLAGLDKENVLILDLYAEGRAQWGGVDSPWRRENGFGDYNWIWSIIPNFGGNVGMFGKLHRMCRDIELTKKHKLAQNMVGFGAAMEGIGTNPIVYDYLFEMAWEQDSIDIADWVKRYTVSRYGKRVEEAEKCWEILLNTVYACERLQQGTSESILCARPAKKINNVSGWGLASRYYDTEKLIPALELLLSCEDELKNVDTYQYDIVDLARQIIADYSLELHKKMIHAYDNKNKDEFKKLSKEFLSLIAEQDKLLTTRKEFLLGHYIKEARDWGKTKEESDIYEWNLRTQITVWGHRAGSEFGLHEYSHREWASLLQDFYLPRWQLFIDKLTMELNGVKVKDIDWYNWERTWTKKTNEFKSQPTGDQIEIAREVFDRRKIK